MGTGQEQILALAFAYAYATAFGSSSSDAGLMIVIEEPEAHLHPLAQKWLGRKIHELSGLGVQVILTTHSAAFIDLGAVEGLVLVRKGGEIDSTRVVQHSRASLADFCASNGAHDKASAATIAPFYASSATDEIVNGLFARACLLVEGPTEALAVPELLRRGGLDVLGEGIAVVPVGGIGNLSRWWRFFRAYGIPVFVLIDSDSSDDASGARRADLAKTLKVPLTALTASDGDGLVIGEGHAVLVEDFEVALRSLFPAYSRSRREVASVSAHPSPSSRATALSGSTGRTANSAGGASRVSPMRSEPHSPRDTVVHRAAHDCSTHPAPAWRDVAEWVVFMAGSTSLTAQLRGGGSVVESQHSIA
jgi:putative ATP-dependent endonuclease of OLD family